MQKRVVWFRTAYVQDMVIPKHDKYILSNAILLLIEHNLQYI